MLFHDDFIESLKTDPVRNAAKIFEIAKSELSPGQGWKDLDLEILTEAYALAIELFESDLLPLDKKYPVLTGAIDEDCKSIMEFLDYIQESCLAETSKLRIESFRSRFRTSLGSGFAYEFSQGDLTRVQQLVNELRAQIADNKVLELGHKQRLLQRLEKLQSELHKKMSDLDRFWGLIGDAGVAIGKLGIDAKPIVDRIREIADIVWQTQSRAEELPSGTCLPSLEHKPSHEDK